MRETPQKSLSPVPAACVTTAGTVRFTVAQGLTVATIDVPPAVARQMAFEFLACCEYIERSRAKSAEWARFANEAART